MASRESGEPAAAEPAETPADEAHDAGQSPEQVQRLEAELDELRAQHARAVADYQNLRRRAAEDRSEQARLTMKALILNYLPVLDDLSRALDSVGEHPEIAEHSWVEGLRIVQRKFAGVLEAGGVQQIEALGGAFDPALHEAVSYQPGAEGLVIAVVQSGYTIDGLVIRPAMVLVGNGESAPDNETRDGQPPGAEPESEAPAGTREDAER